MWGLWNSKEETIEGLEVMNEKAFKKNWEVKGTGGGGQVYQVSHRRWKKDVALKTLCRDDGTCKKKDLVREAKLMLSAENLHTVKILAVFRGSTPFSPMVQWGLVMELMEGGSLNSLQFHRKRQPLPWPLVLRLVHQVAVGMSYLHGLTPALIHKDLKPDNILLDCDLNVKIGDFGLGKFVNTLTTKILEGWSTPFFAPPEALLGGANCAYDVYSYAILVWAILNPAYIIGEVQQSYPERPSLADVRRMKAPGLEELVDLMVKCWNKDPKQRPTFAECTAVTGALYWKHGWSGIDDAVHKVKQQKNDEPGVPEPGVPEPGVPEPDVPEPDVPQPDVPQPGVPEPDVPEPDVPEPDVPEPDVPQPGVPQPDVLQCEFQRLTLDTNTAHRELSLSENNRKVTRQDGRVHSYPDHPDRFEVYLQVLSTESLDERSYIEVQFSGVVAIGVTDRDISRKGKGLDCVLGRYEQSWWLTCRDGYHGHSYAVQHDSCCPRKIILPIRSSDSNRVAVYLDRPAGTLSFYRVLEDALSHLYTFHHTSTKPLYAGFGLVSDYSSVSLCEDRQAVRRDRL